MGMMAMMKGCKGGGDKGGFGSGGFGGCGGKPANNQRSDGSSVGEIRYDDASHAHIAIQSLNGSPFGDSTISVQYDQSSKDGTKLMVTGMPPGTKWQELKDHFKAIGTVAYAGFKTSSEDSGGWGGGGYGKWGGDSGGKGKGWGPY